mmetsp:Transcript_13062/g.21156  ORF Transcript_13062/g.21156 Transcript_13062/m.21156 type:complete len:547 (+) Transcript_13062:151-1791(+)
MAGRGRHLVQPSWMASSGEKNGPVPGSGNNVKKPSWMIEDEKRGDSRAVSTKDENGDEDRKSKRPRSVSRSRSSSVGRRKDRKKDKKKKDRKRKEKKKKKRRSSYSDSESDEGGRKRRRSRSYSRGRSRSRSYSTGSERSFRPQRVKSKRKKPTMWDVKPGDLPPGSMPFQFQSVSAAVATLKETRHARRVYIGGLDNVTEPEIQDFFSGILDAGLGDKLQGSPIISVYVNNEKHFAFVEVNSVELATACMQLDGIKYRKMGLRIRRPADYNPTIVPSSGKPIPQFDMDRIRKKYEFCPDIVANSVADVGVLSGDRPSPIIVDGPNKMFVGGLPHHLNEDQIIELLSAFGKLKALKVIKEPATGKSKGFCFCEYKDPSVTDAAISGLSGLQIGERTLTVRRSDVQENQPIPAASVNDVSNLSGAALLALSGLGPAPGSESKTETRILVLLNMVTQEELADDVEYDDILDDIKTECGKFGKVLSVTIPRPQQHNADVVGKVFVEYENKDQAVIARGKLEGRSFGSNIVKCDYMDPEAYQNKSFMQKQ